MAITTDELVAMLQLKETPSISDETVSLTLNMERRLHIELSCADRGNLRTASIANWFCINHSPFRTAIMTKLLELNHSVELVRIGVDLESGQVNLRVEIPLDEVAPTPRQLERCLDALVTFARKRLAEVEDVAAEGGKDATIAQRLAVYFGIAGS